MEEPQIYITKQKESVWRGYILYGFNYMVSIIWHDGKGKSMETIKRTMVIKS